MPGDPDAVTAALRAVQPPPVVGHEEEHADGVGAGAKSLAAGPGEKLDRGAGDRGERIGCLCEEARCAGGGPVELRSDRLAEACAVDRLECASGWPTATNHSGERLSQCFAKRVEVGEADLCRDRFEVEPVTFESEPGCEIPLAREQVVRASALNDRRVDEVDGSRAPRRGKDLSATGAC